MHLLFSKLWYQIHEIVKNGKWLPLSSGTKEGWDDREKRNVTALTLLSFSLLHFQQF